jgi:hypothetical protein
LESPVNFDSENCTKKIYRFSIEFFAQHLTPVESGLEYGCQISDRSSGIGADLCADEVNMKKQTCLQMRVAGLVAVIILNLGFGPGSLCAKDTPPSPDQGQKVGELNLQGQHIERLVLSQKDGSRKKFDKPGETIKLPVGEYRLQEVRLQGGYSCGITTPISDADWVTVAEDKPAVLNVGAPLKQGVRVERWGRFLVLNYELLGVGGEKYTQADRNKPPTFTVYKAGKEIASGKFEFG